jgi:hypothetical protein
MTYMPIATPLPAPLFRFSLKKQSFKEKTAPALRCRCDPKQRHGQINPPMATVMAGGFVGDTSDGAKTRTTALAAVGPDFIGRP